MSPPIMEKVLQVETDEEYNKDEDTLIYKYPNDLSIVWSEDPRYWKMPANDKTNPAELRQVSWLEVTALVEHLKRGKTYAVGFQISFAPDAFGWGAKFPLYFMTKRGEHASWKKFILDGTKKARISVLVEPPKSSIGGESYSYIVPEAQTSDDTISFGLYEVWSGKWKGGLKIHYAFAKEIN